MTLKDIRETLDSNTHVKNIFKPKEMICPKHQFIKVSEIRDQGKAGATVVCVICGQVRNAYENGKVIVIKQGDIKQVPPEE